MKVIIHDLTDFSSIEVKLPKDDTLIISAHDAAAYCKGCFGCWVKKPGKCIMADRLEDIGSKVIQAEELIIISECTYGGYSPGIKKIIDRCIPGVMPFFVRKNGEMHHAARYDNYMKLTVIYYNEVSEKQMELADELAKANGLNFWAKEYSVSFTSENNIAEIVNSSPQTKEVSA